MAITVFEGCMIVSGAASGNIVLNEVAGQSWAALGGYALSFGVILLGLGVLSSVFEQVREAARRVHIAGGSSLAGPVLSLHEVACLVT